MSTGAGKGDTPRPVDGERFRSGWERIWGGKAADVESAPPPSDNGQQQTDDSQPKP